MSAGQQAVIQSHTKISAPASPLEPVRQADVAKNDKGLIKHNVKDDRHKLYEKKDGGRSRDVNDDKAKGDEVKDDIEKRQENKRKIADSTQRKKRGDSVDKCKKPPSKTKEKHRHRLASIDKNTPNRDGQGSQEKVKKKPFDVNDQPYQHKNVLCDGLLKPDGEQQLLRNSHNRDNGRVNSSSSAAGSVCSDVKLGSEAKISTDAESSASQDKKSRTAEETRKTAEGDCDVATSIENSAGEGEAKIDASLDAKTTNDGSDKCDVDTLDKMASCEGSEDTSRAAVKQSSVADCKVVIMDKVRELAYHFTIH